MIKNSSKFKIFQNLHIYCFTIPESRRQKRSLRQKHKSESGRHNTMTDISEHSPPPYEKSEDTKF